LLLLKKILSVILAGMMVMSMAACSSGSTASAGTGAQAASSESADNTASAAAGTEAASSAGEAKSNSDITIGVILKTLSSEYWNRVANGVKKAEKELGVTVKLQGPTSETAYSEQSNMIETILSSGQIDALCLAPLQPDMVATKLKDATIPVLFVDTDAPYDKKVTFVGTSNEDAAKMGGEYIANLIGKGKKAVLIGGVQGDPTNEARMKGYREALEAGGVEVLGIQYANAEADQAVQVMENFMQRYPEIDAVLCNNDPMAMGAQRAAAQAGKADKIKFLGFDAGSAACESIVKGEETASVAQDAEEMGYQVVVNAVKAVKGEKVENRIVIPTSMVTAENAKEALEKRKAAQ
jgi:ribose transport system substrate-binding protein